MQNLKLLQQAFSEAIFQAPAESPLFGRIKPHGISPQRRLQIYRNNVFTNYTEALAAIFKVVRQLVGEQYFSHLTQQFIPLHRSTTGDIHEFGQHFADFISAMDVTKELPYLADIARLEWVLHEVFHAPQATLVNIDKLATVPENDIDAIIFTLHPALRMVLSKHPILTLWKFHQPETENQTELNIDLDAESVLVFRPQLDIEISELERTEFTLISALRNREPFSLVCEKCVSACPDIDIGTNLQKLIQRNIITGFHSA